MSDYTEEVYQLVQYNLNYFLVSGQVSFISFLQEMYIERQFSPELVAEIEAEYLRVVGGF